MPPALRPHGLIALLAFAPCCLVEDCIFEEAPLPSYGDTDDSVVDTGARDTGDSQGETGDTACEPTGDEIPYDGLDNDCDPSTPDDDLDGDGQGIDTDCDDLDAGVGPKAAEVCLQRARADWSILGLAEQSLGTCLERGDDLDGDGAAELLVGAEAADGWRGGVYLFGGGALEQGATLGVDDALGGLLGSAEYDSIGGAGEQHFLADLDGDGHRELLLACPGADPGGFANLGEVYLMLSAGLPTDGSSVVAPDTAAVSFQGRNSSDRFGESVGVGDLDGDGLDDLLVGSPWDDMGHDDGGAIVLFQGVQASSASVSAADADAWLFGAYQEGLGQGELRLVGDIDGDGRQDLLVGSTEGSSNGVAYLLAAQDIVSGDIVDVAFASILGAAYDDQLGQGARSLGDLDDDGDDELVVSALKGDVGVTNGGGLYLWRGGPEIAGSLEVTSAERSWGSDSSLARAGGSLDVADVDADGAMDLFTSVPWEEGGGVATLLSGASVDDWAGGTLLGDAYLRIGTHEEDGLGSAVLATDLDGQGDLDLLVGAPDASEGQGGVFGFLR